MEKKIPTVEELEQMIKEKQRQIRVAELDTAECGEMVEMANDAMRDYCDKIEHYRKLLDRAESTELSGLVQDKIDYYTGLLYAQEEDGESIEEIYDVMLQTENNLKRATKKLIARLNKMNPVNQKGV